MNDKSGEHKIVEILTSYFPSEGKGTIVDVGGNFNAEVSMPFIRRGWSALIVEPQGVCFEALSYKVRDFPLVHLVKGACSFEAGTMRLYHGKSGEGAETSTLSQRSDPWMNAVRNHLDFEEVQVFRLDDLLLRFSFPHRFNVLKLDTESWDLKVLKGIDFDIYQPAIIVTEEYLWDVEETIEKALYLEEAGYVLLGYVDYNAVWEHRAFRGRRWSHECLRPWLRKTSYSSVLPEQLPHLHGIDVLARRTRASIAFDWAGISMFVVPLKSTEAITGDAISLRVVITNSSDFVIPSLPDENGDRQVCISYHWILEGGGEAVVWDGVRTSLPSDVEPGGACVVDVLIDAPEEPGTYKLEMLLVQEGVSWMPSDAVCQLRSSVEIMRR
jgi:FkbM family methyltransferase